MWLQVKLFQSSRPRSSATERQTSQVNDYPEGGKSGSSGSGSGKTSSKKSSSVFHPRFKIGMHTGSVVGAVIGRSVKRYSLFGDTVNFAARMKSTSEIGRLQVTRTPRNGLSRSKRKERHAWVVLMVRTKDRPTHTGFSNWRDEASCK